MIAAARQRECPQTAMADWADVNRALLAKAIAECCYEQALTAELDTAGHGRLPLSGDVEYRFRAWRSVWDFLIVAPESVERLNDGRRTAATDAAQFFIDAAPDLGMTGVTLGNLLHELTHTLAADLTLRRRRAGRSAAALAALDDESLQGYLDGHPKALANKGRKEWGRQDMARYAPEADRPVQMHWLAVHRDLARCGLKPGLTGIALLAESLDESEQAALGAALHHAGGDWSTHVPLPVHPWQFEQHVSLHYQAELSAGRIIDLGPAGDAYCPLISLRSFHNRQRPAAHHLKLPLTVLNTSCYRGITGRYIEIGAALSAWLADSCARDPLFIDRRTGVLQEVAGIHVPHSAHAQVADSPYRYKEMLGAVWRQSPHALLGPGERHLTYAALLQRDDAGRSIAGALIDSSGQPATDWLAGLFDVTVVPLYHLLCRYGLALVAHAQNLTLLFRADRPCGMLLKDFHGDLRQVALPDGHPRFEAAGTLPAAVQATLTALPPAYLVHDLITGHFVTVLRFLSAALAAEAVIDEHTVYRVLGERLRAYQQTHPELEDRFALFDLFRPRLERVCINRVRFAVGYDDSADRPQPTLGGELINPLWLAEQPPAAENALQKGARK